VPESDQVEYFRFDRSLRLTKAALIYHRTGNLHAVQLLFSHSQVESTVRYLGIEVDYAFADCRTGRTVKDDAFGADYAPTVSSRALRPGNSRISPAKFSRATVHRSKS
jgi:hypothetical protein